MWQQTKRWSPVERIAASFWWSGSFWASNFKSLLSINQSINQSINFVISWCLINATINNYVCTQKIQWENSNQNFRVGIIILHFSQWGRNLMSFPPPGKSFGLIFPVGQGSHWVFDTGVWHRIQSEELQLTYKVIQKYTVTVTNKNYHYKLTEPQAPRSLDNIIIIRCQSENH